MYITFVCLGNICRSPMAEFIAKNFLKTKFSNLDNIVIDSAGTSNYHNGEDMHSMTKKTLRKHNIECNGFISKTIDLDLYEKSDLIVVMDNSNFENIKNMFQKRNLNKIVKIVDYLKNQKYDEVPDPWYTNNFNETHSILSESIENFLNTIKFF